MNIFLKKYSTFLALLSGLFIVYVFVFIQTLLNLESEFEYAFKSKENFLFHEKYSNQLHHIRDESALNNMIVNTNSKDLLFSTIQEKGNQIILFQGDSWINQIGRIQNKKSFDLVRLFGKKKNFKIISAGIPSFSPSLMNLQLDVLEKDFNILPTIIVAFINQLDFGDELCRYKNNKIYQNGKFVNIKKESNFEGTGWYNYTEVYGISKINFQENSNFMKTFHLINFKFISSFKKNLKKIKRSTYKNKIEKKCYDNQIEQYLINPDKSEIRYFEKTIEEYIKKIEQKKHVKKLIIVSFPLKKHFVIKDKIKTYNYNIDSSIDRVIVDKSHFFHLNFSDFLLSDLYFDHSNIWAKDNVHLNPDNHSNLFIKNILKEIDKSR